LIGGIIFSKSKTMKVFLTESSYDAEILIYRVDSEYDADILIYRLESEYDANKGPEFWYFTSDPYDTKAKKIYYVDSAYGNLKIELISNRRKTQSILCSK
jgi:hypothetical protein